MRKYLLPSMAISGSLLFFPVIVMAQSATSTPNVENMKGPPNANGYGKDIGIEKTSPVTGADGTEQNGKEGTSSAKDMKGSPNANGYGK